MLPFKKFLFSSIGKKYVMAVSGLALLGFLVTHLAANLTLLTGDPDLINAYGHGLKTTLGPFFYPAEFGLFGLFVVHAIMAFVIHLKDKSDAPGGKHASGFHGMKSRYQNQRGKGGPSKYGLSASNMIISGGVLVAFLIFHIWQIRWHSEFGSQLTTTLDGEQVADLYRYCAEAFADWWVVVIYVGTSLFLGLHLRHGFWSWVQSLGAMKPEWSKAIYALAALVAFLGSELSLASRRAGSLEPS